MRIELSVILHIILESLPISSSGNLALFGLSLPTQINYATHGATLLIYALFFRKKLLTLLFHPIRCYKNILEAMLFGTLALIPTLACYALIEHTLPAFPLWLGFLITSLALFSANITISPKGILSIGAKRTILRTQNVSKGAWVETGRTAFIIGCALGIALLPGISRLGITYATGRWLGLSWRTSFAFSCMIEAPLLIVASLKGLFDLRAEIVQVSIAALTGYILATVISYLMLCVVYKMAQENSWRIFGVYTAILASVAYMIVV